MPVHRHLDPVVLYSLRSGSGVRANGAHARGYHRYFA
jgi:hypothetical protein